MRLSRQRVACDVTAAAHQRRYETRQADLRCVVSHTIYNVFSLHTYCCSKVTRSSQHALSRLGDRRVGARLRF